MSRASTVMFNRLAKQQEQFQREIRGQVTQVASLIAQLMLPKQLATDPDEATITNNPITPSTSATTDISLTDEDKFMTSYDSSAQDSTWTFDNEEQVLYNIEESPPRKLKWNNDDKDMSTTSPNDINRYGNVTGRNDIGNDSPLEG